MNSQPTKNSSTLHDGINLMPAVTRIHPRVFTSLCVLVILIIGVLMISTFHQSRVSKQNNNESSAPLPVTSDERWYQHEPDSVKRLPVVANLKEIPAEDSLSSTPIASSKEAKQLQLAMDSPIKASVTNTPVTTNSNALAPSSAESDTESLSGNNKLPLSTAQVTRLKQLVDQHTQVGKESLWQQWAIQHDKDYLDSTLKKPVSPYVLQAGSLIPATLISGINSELPGQLRALVSQNVYDSIRGRYLLIPQGTKLILSYDNHVAYGQNRLLVMVKRLIFLNGNSMDLGGMPGVDTEGYSGLSDQVNHHYLRTYGSSVLIGVISAGLQLSQPQQNTLLTTPSATQMMAAAMGQQLGDTALGAMNKNLNIAPTITIRPGFNFNVQVTADMVFPGSY